MARTKISPGQNQANYIQLTMSSSQSLTSSDVDVAFNTVSLSAGDRLTYSGSRVTIGSGVTRVRVSYSLMVETAGTAPYLFSRINRTGSDVSMMIDASGSAGTFKATSESKLVSVTAGDTIGIKANTGGGSASLATGRLPSLLVEVVE